MRRLPKEVQGVGSVARILLPEVSEPGGAEEIQAGAEEEVTVEVDRSRIIDQQRCPRRRYYGYHSHGVGLQRKSKSLPLVTGGAFHSGAAALLLGGGIEMAVAAAIGDIDDAFIERSVEMEEATPEMASAWDYSHDEQGALVEGLLRAWEFQCGEEFRERFEVLEVEREGRATLTMRPMPGGVYGGMALEIGEANNWQEPDLVLMFRPDAVVRERATGDLFLISWKTCSSFGKMTINQARTDHQSISEVWGWQEQQKEIDTVARELPDGSFRTGPMKIEGVVYIFCVKGKREKDDFLGLWIQNSHLVQGWCKLGDSPEESEWSWRYSWTDESEINPKTGKPVGHKLGKGWQRKSVWNNYPGGVKQWIADLGSRRVNPRHLDPFESIFPQSMPVERRGDEVESWRTQVIAQETQIAEKLASRERALEVGNEKDWLDWNFPQYSHSCFSYNSPCPFEPVCWQGARAEVGDLYQIRQSNHPEGKGEDE